MAPLLKSIRVLTEQIRRYDEQIERLAEKKYPETRLLRQVKGVGPLIALTYVLTIEDPTRFRRSRDVGSFLGCGRSSASQATVLRNSESRRAATAICAGF